MTTTANDYRQRVSKALLGEERDFLAYFKLYDERFRAGVRNAPSETPQSPQTQHPISHEDILEVADKLKSNSQLTLKAARDAMKSHTPCRWSLDQLDFAIELAVQAMFMVDAMVDIAGNKPNGTGYMYGGPGTVLWSQDESLLDLIAKCFPQVPAEKKQQVQDVIADRRSLKAWKLKKRLGIKFEATDNLANHLLFDRQQRVPVVYLFHHAEYLKAHLKMWYKNLRAGAKYVETTRAIEKGTLSPRLLAETLHSLQSILFHYSDKQSIEILQKLVKKKDFDASCITFDGYLPFQDDLLEDNPKDFVYKYWGDRLAIIHAFAREKPPQNVFSKFVKRQTTDRNLFIIAVLALIVSAVVGIIQTVIACLAWKLPKS